MHSLSITDDLQTPYLKHKIVLSNALLWLEQPPSQWTDHGYKLGEHCDWFKHDNYEDSTRIVTIIKPAEGLIPNMRGRGTPLKKDITSVRCTVHVYRTGSKDAMASHLADS